MSQSFNNNFIYYLTEHNNYKRTKQPFIKPAVVYNNKIIERGKARCYVYGKVKKGGYLSTYYLHGVGFATNAEEIAFARALQDKETDGIGVINVEII